MIKELLLKILGILTGPFDHFRQLLVQGLVLVERKRPLEASLKRLLEMRDYFGNMIDERCVEMGNGVHLKHEIMDGIHSFFCERISPDSAVLDVGCGIGALAYAIACRTKGQVTGIDYNESHIEFARNRFVLPNLSFIVADATQSLPGQEVDVVVLSSVLEHIEKRSEFLRSIVSAHGPQKLLIRVPSVQRDYYVPLKKRLGLFSFSDPDHKTEYTEESLRKELEEAGLKADYVECKWGDFWVECRKDAV